MWSFQRKQPLLAKWVVAVFYESGWCVGVFYRVRDGLNGAPYSPKWPKNAKCGHFWAISRPGSSKLVDKCRSRLTRTGAYPGWCVGVFDRVRDGLNGAPYHPKWPKKAKYGHFWAISRPGSSKLVNQCRSRLTRTGVHPGWCVGVFYRVRDGLNGALYLPEWPKKAKYGHFWAISRPGSSKLVNQCRSWLTRTRIHIGWCVREFYRVRDGLNGALYLPKFDLIILCDCLWPSLTKCDHFGPIWPALTSCDQVGPY